MVTETTTFSRGGGEVVPHGQPSDRIEDVDTYKEAEEKQPDEKWVFWSEQIKAALNAESRFREEGRQAEISYFGQADRAYTSEEYKKEEHRMNVIHANTEVLKPLLFSDVPEPIVRRRFMGDGADNDPTDRIAALVAERLGAYLVETTSFEEAMEMSRDDWLVPGRGIARVMYKADFDSVPVIGPDGMPMVDPTTGEPAVQEVKRSESIKVRHWPWARTLCGPTDSWDDIPFMAFETPLTRSKATRRFGAEKAEALQYPINGKKGSRHDSANDDDQSHWNNNDEETTNTPTVNANDQCIVYEIWDMETRKIIWWSPHYRDGILDEKNDPYQLEHFFNCPRPLLAITKNGGILPRPYVAFYRARADEIDKATRKLAGILDTISVSGVYPGKMADEVKKLLDGSNKVIPIEEWMAFVEKGGANNLIEWLPMDAMIKAAQALVEMREQAKQAIYEISGISDIVRGQSDARETLGAQQLKGSYSNIRLRDKQRTMNRFARDTIKIMIEIACEHFDTKTIKDIVNLTGIPETDADLELMNAQVQMAEQQHAQATQIAQQAAQMGLQVQPPPPMPPIPHYEQTSWERIHNVLRNDMTRKFSLSIETDATILQDQEEDKRARIEFLQAFTAMAQEMFPLVTQGIVEMKVVKEMLLFAVRGFPKSRTLEGMIQSLPDEFNTEPPENPAVTVANIKAEADRLIAETKISAENAQQQSEQAHETRLKGMEIMAETMLEAAKPEPKTPAR